MTKIITGSEILDEPAFYHEAKRLVEMPVHGGLCRLRFYAGVATGPPGSDSSPGVGFEMLVDVTTVHAFPSDRPGVYTTGIGGIGRSGAKDLHALLTAFLAAPETPP